MTEETQRQPKVLVSHFSIPEYTFWKSSNMGARVEHYLNERLIIPIFETNNVLPSFVTEQIVEEQYPTPLVKIEVGELSSIYFISELEYPSHKGLVTVVYCTDCYQVATDGRFNSSYLI